MTGKRIVSPISRKLALAFGAVSVLAAVECVIHVVLIGRVADEVVQMQHDEHSIREGLELAKAVREQYIHAAHTMVTGDRSHLEHYVKWVHRVRDGADRLLTRAPAPVAKRLDRVVRTSRALDELYRVRMLPALDREDRRAVRALHLEVERLSKSTADDADEIARSFEQRMSRAHVDTTHMTHLGLALALGGIALIVAVGGVSTRQLRTAVIRPLRTLTDAAANIGRGAFETPIGDVGDGEFRELANAFELMARELRQREEKLVASARLAAIGQLAAGVAHEINNPIGVIRGYLRTMIPEATDPAIREELAILDEEAAACERIAEDLLTYARTPDIASEPLDVASLLEETVRRFEATNEAAGVRLEVRAERRTLPGDAMRLKQVISNLLKNAVHASASEIVVTGESVDPDTYCIRVQDRGVGMTPEQLARVFEPFFTARRGGTGLGLSVCEGIVRAHGGHIAAAARPGGGSVFEIVLPAADA